MINADENPEFRPCHPCVWKGRYGRVTGGTTWKVASISGDWHPVVKWSIDDMMIESRAQKCEGARRLAAAVVQGKRHLGSEGGGSFVINEFGQVIVPSSHGDGRRVLMGEVAGGLILENPLGDSASERWIQLWNTDNLEPGDPWPLPYLGVQYNLNGRSRIYYYRTTEDGGGSEFPVSQDEQLIQALRKIRRTGAVRFVVNPYGVVLTKRPAGSSWSPEENWEPVYVGRIDYKKWFRKES